MLNKLRNFSKTKLSTLLVVIIIIPFIFWGMGNVFSGGNTNNLAKINKKNISTKKFVDYLSFVGVNQNYIRKNIDNNIIENLLKNLISEEVVKMEIDNNSLLVSDKILLNKIKNKKIFHDDKNQFSRVKYEKFLLENNISAANYEIQLRKTELEKKLYYMIVGGTKAPYFLINKKYTNDNKLIDIEYLNLASYYKKNFTDKEIKNFIDDNEDKIKKDFIDASYIKITPNNLIDQDEFNKEFFNKIDEIDNLINSGTNIDDISKKYNFKPVTVKNYYPKNQKNEDIIKDIYNKRNGSKINLVDNEKFFLLYEITKTQKLIPDFNDDYHKEKLVNQMIAIEKLKFNRDLILKINNNNFSENDFYDLSNNLVKKMKLNNINDISFFTTESVNLIYSNFENNYVLCNDNENNIFLVKINKIEKKNIDQSSEEYNEYNKITKNIISTRLYEGYDELLNINYKIIINGKTIEKLKNNLR